MDHKINKYIIDKLEELDWKDKELTKRSKISQGQISKLKKGLVKRLSAQTFYLITKLFNDTVSNSAKIVYPNQKFILKKWIPKERNAFGNLMRGHEISKNSLEEISSKTGIKEARLHDLYFRKGALDAYELILIEKALGKKAGELFELLYGNP